eukprot:1424279-Pleurochrysis_carterae.AAC.1
MVTVLPSTRSVWKRASPSPSRSPCLARIPSSLAHSCSASASSHSARVRSGWNVALTKPEFAHRGPCCHSTEFSNDEKVAL